MPERRAVPVHDLSEREVDLIAGSEISEGTPYRLADVPDGPDDVTFARHRTALPSESNMPRFSLSDYEMRRDPGETDASYDARLALFR